jgi:hypothetical protein
MAAMARRSRMDIWDKENGDRTAVTGQSGQVGLTIVRLDWTEDRTSRT